MRALYSDDDEFAAAKREELLEARESGGWYMELGSNGGIVYTEWTCEWCGRTLRDVWSGEVSDHKWQCRERP